MSKPHVSVIIPTYNREHLIVDAVESVLAQTFKDYEIIIVDDGSTDGTALALHPYSSRLTYKLQKNRGVAAARNTGIGLAQGEFICFLDSDDLWKPTKLETQVQFSQENPQYALISSEICGFDSKGENVGLRKSETYNIHNGYVVEQLLFGNWIQTSTVMLRKKVLLEVGGFDEDVGQFGEDWLLWMRVAACSPIYFLPEPLVLYRFHSDQLTKYRTEEQFQSLMCCIQKLSDLPQFQKNPGLLQEAEYRICIGRAWRDRAAGNYDLAMAKLQRAARLRRVPIVPFLLMIRTMAMGALRRRHCLL